MKHSKPIATTCLIALLLIITTITTYAQPGSDPDLPCPPDEVCPLDNWVIIFSIIMLFITTLYLYRKKEHQFKSVK